MQKKLISVAKNILTTNVCLESGKKVCIISDSGTKNIGEAFWEAATEMGTDPVLCLMRPRQIHGNEPPEAIAAAMKTADILIMPTTYALGHTKARLDASAAGAKVLIMRSVTEDSFLNGAINVDYEDLMEVTNKAAAVLQKGKNVHMTSPQGTDIKLSIENRTAYSFHGMNFREGSNTVFALPAGEAPTSPLEGTAEGILVIDYMIDGIGLLTEPIKLTVKAGRIVEVEGGEQADELRKILAMDPNANNIAEFAIATNPKSRMHGNAAEDKIRRGSVHVGFGDNSKTLNGTVASTVHIDATLYKPSVWIDGNSIIENGELNLMALAALAD